MSYSVLIAGEIAAKNIDSLNKFGKAAVAVENGHVVALGDRSDVKGENDVYNVNVPATATLASDIFYMVNEPVNVLVNGKYSGLTDDPREFNIPAGKKFTMYKPMIGDEVVITEDGLAGTKSSNTYVVPADDTTKLTWAANGNSVSLAYKYVGDTYVSIGNERVTAYRFICVKA
jgi:hypothetical protein